MRRATRILATRGERCDAPGGCPTNPIHDPAGALGDISFGEPLLLLSGTETPAAVILS